ncbi:SDR family NAD(P)-dependent oxidoreductase [Hydrotalea sp.]|uniref:SDR family NAD(P)-dependent oxidoreductase n=1 Tax=Hydrotalea sp. TaxID=2881279 RepID=UPI0025851691|nr:SDR family NAD(P)-dependent oxidoreductase [Hydrotalea sp.]
MPSKIVLVTGAAGNLGKAVAQKFADNQYQVYGFVHKKQGNDNDTVPQNPFIQVELDLLNEAACSAMVQNITESSGSIDVAVLTAGGFAMGNIAVTDTKAIQAQMQLNFETAYNIARPVFLQMMQQKQGRMFLTGSKAGLNTTHAKGVTAYGLSKSLLFRLAEIMNTEAKGTNVVVAVIVPTVIDTPQNRADMPDADFSTWTKPETIAHIIYDDAHKAIADVNERVIII